MTRSPKKKSPRKSAKSASPGKPVAGPPAKVAGGPRYCKKCPMRPRIGSTARREFLGNAPHNPAPNPIPEPRTAGAAAPAPDAQPLPEPRITGVAAPAPDAQRLPEPRITGVAAPAPDAQRLPEPRITDVAAPTPSNISHGSGSSQSIFPQVGPQYATAIPSHFQQQEVATQSEGEYTTFGSTFPDFSSPSTAASELSLIPIFMPFNQDMLPGPLVTPSKPDRIRASDSKPCFGRVQGAGKARK
ncbi:hypothetical protein BT96DRAFT_952179 [Gymnopus androsaceus JB14]|uniref:Uncharacterized protein n=1 Tax=Gymnopus androsaceus JB14 TaxID=1447944 RepID=A0A6A4GAG1_9AGAR|nr:hypothetical protein BT96DRAFT_952179 [Gymnopus androsaceus JB14]